jgi:hypothetical protein
MRRLPVLPLALLCIAAQAPHPPRPAVPVMVGGDADYDACGAVLKVTGLNPRGQNYLSLRSAPSPRGRDLARLRPGQMVWDCDKSRDGTWIGVVYSPPGKDLDCGVGTPIARPRPYRGPCASGWVSGKFLELVAG